MIDFQNVKSIIIPEGEVSMIARGAEILWQKIVAPLYTEVEYIESTGTQWINTGIYPTDNTIKVEVKIAYSTTSTGQLMGSGTSGTERFNFGIESSRFRFGFGTAWFDANKEVLTANTDPHVWVLDANTKTGSIDGIEAVTTYVYTPGGSRAMVLFARGTSTVAEASNRTRGKIYYAKIWNKGNLVRDFIPVLDTEGVPCMYDKVSGEFFYNHGTGEFLYGEIPTSKYKVELAYLESTGTQYIDTGIVGKDGVTSDCSVYRTTTNSNECFCGAYGSSKRLWLVYTFGNNWYRGYNNAAGSMVASTPINEWVDIKVSTSGGAVTYNINGTDNKANYTQNFTTNLNVYLFAMSTDSGTNYWSRGRMSACKLYDGNILVRDFIPVLDWDARPCMYDKITDTLFYNQGTGEFSYAE